MLHNIALRALTAATLLILFVSSCTQEKEPEAPKGPEYTVPSTYNFENSNGESTVSFDGQKQRLDMLSEMTTYMKSANNVGVSLDAQILKDMYANDNYTWEDENGLGLTGSSKQLKSKTAAGDAGVQAMFEAYMDDIANISLATEGNVDQNYGQGGVWTNGNSSYLQSAEGIEYTQLIEKGLMCAVFMNQMTANYLSDLDEDDNTEILEGKTYTEMQHHWDEAYGYLTSEIDFPLSGTDRFWGKYSNGREEILGSATILSEAFRTGRAAIDAKDYETRDEQVDIIRNEMERVCAATAIHYLNDAKAYITDPTKKNHVLSEAHAFIDGLRYGYNAISGDGMTAYNIDLTLTYIGDDFELVTIEAINNAIDVIAEETGLENVKDNL